ncbi:MAG: hypothetical protein GC185_07645 [Alphaproteobacteria bacterium]|nr:hypothetical protein [Alphaproteobacteria bacterium]
MHDITSNIGITQCLAPQTIDSSALDSGSIDMQGADCAAVAVFIGAMGDTLSGSARIDLKIEHADDDGAGAPGSFAACTDEDVLNFTGLDASGIFESVDADAKAQKRYVVGYRGGKRFIKVTATPTGLSSGGPVAMACLTGAPHEAPVDNS